MVKTVKFYVFCPDFYRYLNQNIAETSFRVLSMAERKEQGKGKMTVEEAGHKGGERTAETHGREFYEEIGHKGGEKTSETHGKEFYQQIGQKGGQKVRELIEKAGGRNEEKGR